MVVKVRADIRRRIYNLAAAYGVDGRWDMDDGTTAGVDEVRAQLHSSATTRKTL